MARTFIRPETQIKTLDVFDDTVSAGSGLETTTWNMEQFLQGVISQLNRFLNTSTGSANWYDDLATATGFEGGAQRGINELNQDLHDTEHKRVLRSVANLTDVGPLGSVQHVVLGTGELPSNTTAAIGAVTTLGTVCAYEASFNTATLTEVSGSSAINPKNLVQIVDATTRDPILDSSGKQVWGLFQSESNTDGSTITDTTPNRVQISFVVINASGDDLQLVAAADMNGKTFNYASVERVNLLTLNEQDFLRGAVVDVSAGGSVTRQQVYDNQSTTPVDLTTNATLDLEGAGLVWAIRDDLEATLIEVIEGSAGGTSQFNIRSDVDEFDVDAAVNNFLNGVTVDSGGTSLNLGVTGGQIDSAGALTLASAAASDLTLDSANDVLFDDGYRSGSTFGVQLPLASSSAEWDSYETEFGEVSLMNAIVQAANADNRLRAVAAVTSGISADTLIEGPNGPGTQNISADLLDYRNVGSFVDDVEIYINGVLMRNGADSSANYDVYPSAVSGEQQYGCFYAEFALKATPSGDVIQMFLMG